VNPTGKDPLQRKLEIRNWIALGVLLLVSAPLAPKLFTLGILCGGVLSIVNYYWMYRSLKKAFFHVSDRTKSFLIVRYYIRFVITGIILFLLITKTPISVFGLILGLSVVVINIFITTIIEVSKKNLILKTKEVF
jgi:hypothetical protein